MKKKSGLDATCGEHATLRRIEQITKQRSLSSAASYFGAAEHVQASWVEAGKVRGFELRGFGSERTRLHNGDGRHGAMRLLTESSLYGLNGKRLRTVGSDETHECK